MNAINLPFAGARGDIDIEWLTGLMELRPTPPAGEEGGVELTVQTLPPMTEQTVVSLRNSLFMGYPPTKAVMPGACEIRRLTYKGGEWMADTPQEVWQMHEVLELLLEHDEPEVLVGGLGLGVFTHLATEYAGAIATTVEKDSRVIALVAAHAARNVVNGCIYEFCEQVQEGDFDVAFLDTWQSTGEYCWNREVVPLRRILGDKVPEVFCWNEQEMVGQIYLSATRAMCLPLQRIPPSSTHWRVLRLRAERLGIEEIPDTGINDMMNGILQAAAELQDDEQAQEMLSRFTHHAGSESWEAEFGGLWDEQEAEYNRWAKAHKLDG